MNETERDRILRMVAEGTLRPHEAAHLLAALADTPPEHEKNSKKDKPAKTASPLVEVQMERSDGSHYTLKVPPSLVPMLWEITKATVKESARSAAQDTWDGLKTIVRKKSMQVRTNVRDRLTGSKHDKKTKGKSIAATPEELQQAAARRQILEMVQDGRVTAADAGRLITQLDAHVAYRRKAAADRTGSLP